MGRIDVLVLDYGMGNFMSVANMLRKAGATATVSSDPADVAAADRVILPGVGAFDNAMARLHKAGFVDVLHEHVLDRARPVLGICLGMQLLGRGSEEGVAKGLGWIEADTVRFDEDTYRSLRLPVPHMGWNMARATKDHPVLAGIEEHRYYYVHSYHMRCDDPSIVLLETDYGAPVTSAVAHGNIIGTQFHPEKSHKYGLRLLSNFAAI